MVGAQRAGRDGIIDEVAGARRADAGASVGTYLALADLNRVVSPCSKLAFADWWAATAADRWVKVPRGGAGSPPVLGRDGRGLPGAAAEIERRSAGRSLSGSAWTCPPWCWT